MLCSSAARNSVRSELVSVRRDCHSDSRALGVADIALDMKSSCSRAEPGIAGRLAQAASPSARMAIKLLGRAGPYDFESCARQGVFNQRNATMRMRSLVNNG